MKKVLLLGLFFLTVGCYSSRRTVKFSQKQDEITKTESLKKYLASNPNPKIVLRTQANSSFEDVTEKEDNSYLYNIIENELLKSGFVVRDRQLFDKIVTNSNNSNNYEVLKEKSDTDLIIELTLLDRDIIYETNKYHDQKGKERISSRPITYYGAAIEFKVIMINSNEFAGIYKFNYVPCLNGCEVVPNGSFKKNLNDAKKPYESVEENTLIQFVRGATNQLIQEMRS